MVFYGQNHFYCATSFAVTVWCSHIILSLTYNTGIQRLCFLFWCNIIIGMPSFISSCALSDVYDSCPLSVWKSNILSGSLTILSQHCVLMESRVWMRAWNSHPKQTPGSVDATCLMAIPGDCRSDMLFKAWLPARG